MYNVTIFEHVVQIRAFRSTKQLLAQQALGILLLIYSDESTSRRK
jgi:hypothetical protein